MSDLQELMKRAEAIRLQYEESNARNGREAWRIRDYAMGLSGDVGDLMKIIMAKENLRNMQDVDGRLGHELADCLWALLVIAKYYDIDLENEFHGTMEYIADKIGGADA